MTKIPRIKMTIKVTDILTTETAIEVTGFPKTKVKVANHKEGTQDAKLEDRRGKKEYNLRPTAAEKNRTERLKVAIGRIELRIGSETSW